MAHGVRNVACVAAEMVFEHFRKIRYIESDRRSNAILCVQI